MSKSIIKQKRILTKAGGGSSISTPVSVANGGTGISSYAIGDIIYASGATTISKLPIGTASQQLRVNAGATALEYFTPAASGITINSTAITGGGANRILFENSSNQVSESSTNFYFETASPFAHVFAAGRTGTITGVNNSLFGSGAGAALTSGNNNTLIGAGTGATLTTQERNVLLGTNTNLTGSYVTAAGFEAATSVTGNFGVFVGWRVGYTAGSATLAVALGCQIGTIHNKSFIVGYNGATTAENQIMFGGSDATHGGFNDFCVGQGNASSTATGFTFRTTNGLGTNSNGGSIVNAAGRATGSGTPGTWGVQTSTTLGTGTTLQSLVSRLTISGGAVTTDASTATWADKLDFVFNTGTGTKFGTATTQKIGFWNATPIVQPTTAHASATVVHVGGTTYQENDTIDGYTLAQVVKILRDLGILA